MIKTPAMYPWPPDPEHFKKHYIERHLPLCRAIPGALRSHYMFEPRTVLGTTRWFCLFETEYADEATLNAALQTPEAQRARDDVANFAPEPPKGLIYEVHPA